VDPDVYSRLRIVPIVFRIVAVMCVPSILPMLMIFAAASMARENKAGGC
jgi:hypothetical protein